MQENSPERPVERLEGGRNPFAASAFWRALPSGMPRRWWLFRFWDLIARLWPGFKPRRGVLVVRMDGIGDMVLFRRSLDHYAEVFGIGRESITVLGCDSWGPLAEIALAGYRVLTIDEHAFARQPLYRFRKSLMVRRLAPAVAVCDSYFRRPLMADSLVLVSGALRKIVSHPYVNEATRAEFTYYLSQFDRVVNTGVYPTHEIVRHYRFLSAIAGREIAPEPPALPWRQMAPPVVEPGTPYVVLTPGSNEPGRRWPFVNYIALAERLVARGLRVLFVGSADERPPAAELEAVRRRPGMSDLYGETSLPELLDLMSSAAAVVSNDTGPAHLAIALGAPTVVIVGGGHFGSFVPYPPGVTPPNARFVFHEMSCYHCFWRCPYRETKQDVFPCVDKVETGEVWAAVDGLLGQAAPASPAYARG
jgi:ADP-heptose:LPS heptosyltransferase